MPTEANRCVASIPLSVWRGLCPIPLRRRWETVRRRNPGGPRKRRFETPYGEPENLSWIRSHSKKKRLTTDCDRRLLFLGYTTALGCLLVNPHPNGSPMVFISHSIGFFNDDIYPPQPCTVLCYDVGDRGTSECR